MPVKHRTSIPAPSPLDVLKEANERNRSRSTRTLLDMLRNRRIKQEIKETRDRLNKRVDAPEDKDA